MKSFFITQIAIYIFFIIHIILSLSQLGVFPIFNWNLYAHATPYYTLYRVKIIKDKEKSLDLLSYIGSNKYYMNRMLEDLGVNIEWSNKNSVEFKKSKRELEEYILNYVSQPFSYQLLSQKAHLPFYVLSREGGVLSEKIILAGNL